MLPQTAGTGASLAPMVRCGTLPLRLLALEYGAASVYSEETIAQALAETTRHAREDGYVDFVSKSGSTVLRTLPRVERAQLVVQLGAASAVHALAAAELVAHDCAGVDVNMGCPKPFSTTGGMGAALLKDPERAADIVRTLARNLPVPVSCKVRLLDDARATLDFVRAMEHAGASCIAVHARRADDREKAVAARWEALRPVVEAVGVPVLANGDLYTWDDIERVRRDSGCAGVLLARPALLNPSIFRGRERGPLPLRDVIAAYLRNCERHGAHYVTSKYTVIEMMRASRHPRRALDIARRDRSLDGIEIANVSPLKSVGELAALFPCAADDDGAAWPSDPAATDDALALPRRGAARDAPAEDPAPAKRPRHLEPADGGSAASTPGDATCALD